MNILLCCGAGMSSGFLAQYVRGAAKKAGVKVKCEAHSQATIEKVVKDFDVLCIAPHLGPNLKEYEKMCTPYGVPVVVIPSEIYGRLDGKGLYELCKKTVETGEKEK